MIEPLPLSEKCNYVAEAYPPLSPRMSSAWWPIRYLLPLENDKMTNLQTAPSVQQNPEVQNEPLVAAHFERYLISRRRRDTAT